MPHVFISYRRTDATSGYASWIYDRLTAKFGQDSVFMDVDSLPLGVDFKEHVERELRITDVALVLIGPGWLGATDDRGRRRLDDPDDLVRVEVSAALRSASRIIPALFEGAGLPGREELPDELRPLIRRHALTFDRSGGASLSKLEAAIEALTADANQASSPTSTAPTPADITTTETSERDFSSVRGRLAPVPFILPPQVLPPVPTGNTATEPHLDVLLPDDDPARLFAVIEAAARGAGFETVRQIREADVSLGFSSPHGPPRAVVAEISDYERTLHFVGYTDVILIARVDAQLPRGVEDRDVIRYTQSGHARRRLRILIEKRLLVVLDT